MQVSAISFGYSHKLKTLWKKGKLPTVVNGFYGDKLTLNNISLEHLQPHSKGGRTVLDNLVLATAKNNNKRGNQPLELFLNKKSMEAYLAQFKGIKEGHFNGDKYIEKIRKTVERIIND